MKRKVLIVTAALLALVMIFASCSSAPEEAADTAGGESAATEATTEEAPAEAAAEDASGYAEPVVPESGYAEAAPADDSSSSVEMPKPAATAAADSYEYEASAADEAYASEEAYSGDGGSYENYAEFPENNIQPSAGILTAGQWSDHDNWDFFQNVLNTQEWQSYQSAWSLYPGNRIAVSVGDGSKPVEGALVTMYDSKDSVLWKGMTDNKGRAYMFYNIFGSNNERPSYVIAEKNSDTVQARVDNQQSGGVTYLELNDEQSSKSLDLMLVFDTTGSMGDELDYLKKELENVVAQVRSDNGNIPVRVSVNFYRDEGDDYVVLPYAFTENINEALGQLDAQSANGGGDFEEAVDQALENAVFDHDWQKDSTKLMFLILDAPPHKGEQVDYRLKRSLVAAAKDGIRIIPVASSGIDKETEYLLRTFATTTGGTYTFLTDHSGVGESHLDPTIGDYEVEYLNDMLVNTVNSYLKDVPVVQ